MKKIICVLSILSCAFTVQSKVLLPQLFQSGMVLQRNQTIPVWGTADKGEKVTITFKGKTYTATASETDGTWRIDLPKQKAGGPYTMTIAGSNTSATIPASGAATTVPDVSAPVPDVSPSVPPIELADILVGDVWLISGQSNIDCTVERVYPQYKADIDAYSNDNIRLFQVPTYYVSTPQKDVKKTSWKHLNKQNAWKFSAVGYFLGQAMYGDATGNSASPLQQRAGGKAVPQGIIQASLGGTDIQSWMTIDSLRNSNYYTKYLLYTDSAYVASQTAANNRANDVWFQAMNQTDPGIGKYEKESFDDSQWTKYSQYDNNEWARVHNGSNMRPNGGHGGSPILGSMWLRQHITIDKAHAGMAATLNIGTFHDMDYTYVNGKQVGVTYYQYPPRRYTVPAGLLHEGDNVICIRLICKSGMANFYKDKPHNITFSDGSVQQTATDWLIETGSVMPEGPLGGKINTQNQASMLYNGMFHPLAPYALQGIVWYQGENNTDRWAEYGSMLRKLTGNWRSIWNRPAMPFNIVQLANYMEPTSQPMDGGWPALREQQRLFTDNDPYSSLTVNIDLGEASDIHPLRKRELVQRIALALDNQVFGAKNALSPEPVSAKVEGNNVIVTFSQGLQQNNDVCEFEVKGADGKYHNAKASTGSLSVGKGKEIHSVAVTIPDGVTSPSSIRYAWKNNPAKANLLGKNGLPASPFQIDVK